MTGEQERQVIDKARSGDRMAVKQLYDCYSGYISSVCSRFLSNVTERRDAIQDSFVKVFTSLDRFDYRGEGSFKAWARQVAVNECLKVLRGRRKGVPLVLGEEVKDVAEEEEADPPDIMQVPAKVVQEMIEGLPEGYRTVFNLYALEEKSHKEIASLLGISESTSASQLYRARVILAKKIKDYISKVKIKQ